MRAWKFFGEPERIRHAIWQTDTASPCPARPLSARGRLRPGCDRLLTLYPGAIEAFDRALAADPGFALAHAGKAQVLMREGNVRARARVARGGPRPWPLVCRRARPATSAFP